MRALLLSAALYLSVSSTAVAACMSNGPTTTCTSDDGATGVGQNGGDGADLPAPSYSGNPPPGEQRFEAGAGGSTTSPGFNGGNGGDVGGTVTLDIVVPNSFPGSPAPPFGHFDFQLYLQGGPGGGAGAGGVPGSGGKTAPIEGSITGQSGADINIGSIGGHGGNAGKSGDIDLALHGEFGEVYIGTAGGGGGGGIGSTTQGLPGDAGNVDVTFDGKASQMFIYAATGYSENGAPATPPTVSVVVDGQVTGDLYVESRYQSGPANAVASGLVTVRLEDNAEINGKIINRGEPSGRLEFAMEVASEAEYSAISEALSAAGANGIATVNGKTYQWEGFSDLANLITVLQRQNPGAPVSVSVAAPPTSPGDGATVSANKDITRIRQIACNKPRFFALVRDGEVELLGVQNSKKFIVGRVRGDRFTAAENTGWSAVLALLGDDRLVADLRNPDGTVVTRCIFPRM